MPSPQVQPDIQAPAQRVRWGRIAAFVVLVVGLVVAGRLSGLTAELSTERVRTTMMAAGVWGPILFVLAFCLGELVHVPGTVFVAAAVVAYGRVGGGALALVGAIISVSASFVVVRWVGGKPLGAIRWRFMHRILAYLEGHPVRTVLILRLVLWMAPELNYALALSNVGYRPYLVGSALGLVAPIGGTVLLFDYFFN
jgi:uncharacterized membrane protein YdjX (TVP38/TMEM64 family)